MHVNSAQNSINVYFLITILVVMVINLTSAECMVVMDYKHTLYYQVETKVLSIKKPYFSVKI